MPITIRSSNCSTLCTFSALHHTGIGRDGSLLKYQNWFSSAGVNKACPCLLSSLMFLCGTHSQMTPYKFIALWIWLNPQDCRRPQNCWKYDWEISMILMSLCHGSISKEKQTQPNTDWNHQPAIATTNRKGLMLLLLYQTYTKPY